MFISETFQLNFRFISDPLHTLVHFAPICKISKSCKVTQPFYIGVIVIFQNVMRLFRGAFFMHLNGFNLFNIVHQFPNRVINWFLIRDLHKCKSNNSQKWQNDMILSRITKTFSVLSDLFFRFVFSNGHILLLLAWYIGGRYWPSSLGSLE